jgi:hypothetical protein
VYDVSIVEDCGDGGVIVHLAVRPRAPWDQRTWLPIGIGGGTSADDRGDEVGVASE